MLDTAGNTSPEQVLGGFNVTLPLSGPFQVNSFSDTVDADPGDGLAEDADGNITLRSAIIESNALAGLDTIELEAGTYTLSLAGADEDAAATGDLDITDTLTIIGRGINTTTIDANDLDRVLHISTDADILVRLTDLTLVNGAVTGDGGGILNSGRLELTRVKIASSAATGSGGAIHNSNHSLTLIDSHLADNQAIGGGGGLFNSLPNVTITNSTLSGNIAGTSGGGLLNAAGVVAMTSVTFSGNQAAAAGGAIYNSVGSIGLTNLTIVNNTTADKGGGVALNSGSAIVTNSIIADNTSANGDPDADVSGAYTSQGNNLVGDPGTSTGFSTNKDDQLGSASNPLDPKLASLGNNGGSTPTHYPLIDSPVIDAGTNAWAVNLDQRGVERPQDGDDSGGQATVDIGSVEFVLYTQVHGLKYHDYNGNGQRDPGEEGLSGWTIFIDTNENGLLDEGEPNTESLTDDPDTMDVDETGQYSLIDLLPGDYVVAEVPKDGWQRTDPAPAPVTYMAEPSLVVGDVSQKEGDIGTTNLVFDATLSWSATAPVSVDYVITDVTTDGSDLAHPSGTLVIPAGTTSGQVTVTINGDTETEQTEQFQLLLSNPDGVVLPATAATATIVDDDATWLVNSELDNPDLNPGDGVVTTATAGEVTLRAAIMEANALAGDQSISLPAGSFMLSIAGAAENNAATGDLDVTDSTGVLTIMGSGSESTTINADGLDRVFDLHTDAQLELLDLTLAGGTSPVTEQGGGVRAIGAELTLSRVTVSGNESAAAGGGLAGSSSAQLTLVDSRLTTNTTAADGGGLLLDDSSTAVIKGSELDSNTAGTTATGGGIASLGTLDVLKSKIHDNQAGSGAGVHAWHRATFEQALVFANSTFTDGDGAGLYLAGAAADNGDFLVSASTIHDNIALGDGGGLAITATTSVLNSTIARNIAFGDGGGILTDSITADLQLLSTTITENRVAGEGGGLIRNKGVVQIGNTIISGNESTVTAPNVSGSYDQLGAITGPQKLNIIGGDARLENVGPLHPSYMPMADSPAVDAGAFALASTLDGRFVTRSIKTSGRPGFITKSPPTYLVAGPAAPTNNWYSEIYTGLLASDLDADSNVDVIAYDGSSVYWQRNLGDGIFSGQTIITASATIQSIVVDDFDGDADTDVLVSTSDDKISWYENDGSETFTALTISDSANSSRHLEILDMDNDGDSDIVAVESSTKRIVWYENDGEETFIMHVVDENTGSISVKSTADFDGDGSLDILSSTTERDITLYYNDGNNNFAAELIYDNTYNGPPIAVNDFDADGDMDFIVSLTGSGGTRLFDNDGDGGFTQISINGTGSRDFPLRLADLDNDGDMDLVQGIFTCTYDHLRWMENVGPDHGRFKSESIPAGRYLSQPNSCHNDYAIYNVTVADLNGDEDQDLIVQERLTKNVIWLENGPILDIGAMERSHPDAHGEPYRVSLSPGQVIEGADFGDLSRTGEIRGVKFQDLNENGVHDTGEPGLSGWTIFLDLDGDGMLDPGETSTTTAVDGYYQFTDLPTPVDYTVREVLPSGWLQTAPASTSHVVSLGSDEHAAGKDFGNSLIPGEIHGVAYRDDDRDGVRDVDEPALENWTIYLDDNQNGIFNPGEPTATTDANGSYSFTDLEPLITYHVGEIQQLGFLQTGPVATTGDPGVGVNALATDSRLKTAWDIDRGADGSFHVTGLDGIGSGFNSQAIFHVSADGATVDIQTPANQPRGVTSDNEYLYYVDTALSGSGTAIYRRPIEGGAREQIVDGPTTSPAISSARDVEFTMVDNESVLIVTDDLAGRVFKVTLGGTSPVVEQLGPDRYADSADRRHASHIVVENDTVYLADTGVAGFGDTPVRVLSIGLDDDDFTELFSGSTDDYSLRGIAVSDGTIFLADEDEILELPIGGGTPTQLTKDPRFGDLQGLAYHNGHLYVLDNTDATESVLWKVTLDSEVTTTIDQTWAIELSPGAVIDNRNFANATTGGAGGVGQTARIMGHWFNDIDADGIRDTGEPGLSNQTVYLDLNNNGTLEPGEPTAVTASDDSATDDDENGLYLFSHLAAGNYTVSTSESTTDWTQTLPLETGYAAHTLSAADGPAGVGTIDANDDGHLDLVATNRDTNTVSIFTATGDGDYLDPVEYEVGVGPAAVVTGDMDDDGIDDLVVANLYTSNVSVLRGDGNGGFHDAVNTSVGSGPFDLLVVDLDGDGDLDVATANEFSNNVSVLLNDGDSTLGDLDHTGVGNSAESVIAGDWDQDGDVDLAAAVFESNEVVILENNGSAAFSVGDRHTVGTGPFSLDAADFDNDGDTDLVSANLLSNDVTVLLNGGASGFQAQLPLATGYGPMAIASTDMDNDGDVDIAVANATSTNVSIMLNNGSGLFAAARSYGVGDFPNLLAFSLAVTDLDGDGTHDIVLANGRDDSLAVLRNEEVPGSHRMTLPDGQTAEGVDFGVYQDYSAHFDDDSGLLLIGANQPQNIVVDVVDGNVRIMVNGQLDDALGVVDPSDVQELRFSGSAAADLIDLSGVTAADFDHASGLTTRIETGDGNDTIIGSGLPDTILSGNGDDTIDGGDGNDKLNGGGGNDTATGGAGQDIVDGGGGEDVLSGGDGDDTVRGQGSEDTLTGGAGDDIIDGGPAYDQLRETADVDFTITDTSLSGVGTDELVDLEETYLTGGSSANTFDGKAFDGRVIVNAKGGNDTIDGGVRADRLLGGSGRDLVRGGVGNDVVRGQGGNNDTVLGEEGDDRLDGGVGNDILDGGPGNDKLTGGTGDDTIDGGEGTDKVQEFGDFNMTLTDSLLTTGGAGTDTIQNVETAYLKAGHGDNQLTTSGFAGHVTLVGLNGDDTLTSGSGNDNLAGRAGNDVMNSGDGDDTVLGHRGADSVTGGGGNDSLVTHDGNDTIDAGTGNDTVFGGDDDDSITSADGSNMLSGGNGNDVVTGGLGADVLLGGSGNDNLSGGAGNDDLEAGDGTDTLQGQAGNDSLDGGGGDDELLGGDDDDLLETGGGADTVDGGTGDDLLVHADSGDITVTDNSLVGTVSLVLADLENIDLAGDELANFLDARGYTGTATLRGGDGDDTLASGPGDDRLLGEGGNDILAGFAGNDVFNGGSGDDSMLGGDGNDTLSGANGDDAVVGQGGDDSVKGQGGTDTLAGGSGGGAKDSGDVLSDATAGEIDEAFSLDFDDLIGQTN